MLRVTCYVLQLRSAPCVLPRTTSVETTSSLALRCVALVRRHLTCYVLRLRSAPCVLPRTTSVKTFYKRQSQSQDTAWRFSGCWLCWSPWTASCSTWRPPGQVRLHHRQGRHLRDLLHLPGAEQHEGRQAGGDYHSQSEASILVT